MRELRLARGDQTQDARRPRRTRSARASASSASRTRARSSCSGPPATSPIARSSRPSTSCGGRTSCRTSSSSSRSAGASTTTTRSATSSGRRSRSTRASCRSTRRPGARSRRGSATSAATSPIPAGFDRLAKTPRGDRPRAEQPGQPPLLPRDPAVGSSPRSSPSSGGSGSTTSATRAAGGGSSSRSRSATTSNSAIRLNREVGKVFRESQVYRIDHYLGKETVRNLLVFRFGNGIFEPIWNRRHIDHVQITVAESIGVENRGAFYEETGRQPRRPPEPPAPADEPGRDGAAGDVRGRRPARREGQGHPGDRRADAATRSAPTSSAASTARAGSAAKPVPGYREEPEVDPESETETFVAARLEVDDWRWSGVPVLPADRQAPAEAGDRDRDPVQGGPPPAVPGLGHRARAEPARDPDPAGRGDHAPLRGQGARASGSTSGR